MESRVYASPDQGPDKKEIITYQTNYLIDGGQSDARAGEASAIVVVVVIASRAPAGGGGSDRSFVVFVWFGWLRGRDG